MPEGFLYKICCLDVTKDQIYVGSCNSLKDRKYRHKYSCSHEADVKHNYPVYQYIRENGGYDNFDFIVLEKIEYDEKYELHARERYWIETLKASLNAIIPTRTRKEHYEDNKVELIKKNRQWVLKNPEKNKEYHNKYYRDNKEEINVRKKEYNQENKEYFAQKKKEYYLNNKDKFKKQLSICECGKEIHGHNTRHIKSKRHIEWSILQGNPLVEQSSIKTARI